MRGLEAHKLYKVTCEVVNMSRFRHCFCDVISYATIEPLLLDVHLWGQYAPFWNTGIDPFEGKMRVLPMNSAQPVEADRVVATFEERIVLLSFRDEEEYDWGLQWYLSPIE